jgi:hypothetical protein
LFKEKLPRLRFISVDMATLNKKAHLIAAKHYTSWGVEDDA